MTNTIIIRFIDSEKGGAVPDYAITDTTDISYKKLKQAIRQHNSLCTNRRLKLIYNGRVLNEFFDFKHELISKFTPENDKIYIHCVIGETLSRTQLSKENELDNQQVTRSTQPEVIGFDRLLQQGFSQQDIDDLRAQFEQIYNITSSNNSAINDLEEEEQRRNYVRQLEERWINLTVTQGANTTANTSTSTNANNTSATPANENDTEEPNPVPPQAELDGYHNEDLLIGLLIGVFLGVVSIIFILADDTVFNKRQKMAVIAGLFINFSIAIVRGQWI